MRKVSLERDENSYFIPWIRKEWKLHNERNKFYQLNLGAEVDFKENDECYKIIFKNTVVGFIQLRITERMSHGGKTLYIYRFFVDDKYRGAGIGTQVMEHIIEMAKKFNMDLELDVFEHNPAVKLYERFGFETFSKTMICKIKRK